MVQYLSLIWFFSHVTFSTFPAQDVFYHPVTTDSVDAQKAFDRGLLAHYSFNDDEAFASFKKASELDPNLAMAYWGMALCHEEESNKTQQAETMTKKALELSSKASENERDYIEAYSKRFLKEKWENKHVAYRDAMKEVMQKYPDDPDAATLYAESLMTLVAWQPWRGDFTPRNKMTNEIVETLNSTLKRAPDHPGANHYYIHAIEGSRYPERALISAERLAKFTEWGHLLHSSSHIYLRVGDYEKSVEANLRAYEADKNLKGMYAIRYLTHTLFFLTHTYLWQDRREESIKAAKKIVDFLSPHLEKMPGLENNLLTPLDVYLYFHEWDEILKTAEPDEKFALSRAYWHFARAMAFIGKGECEQAEKEKSEFLKYKKENKLLELAAVELEAHLTDDIECLKQAVVKEDELGFLGWYHQNRQTLGAALLQKGKPEEAECVFREALNRLPRNGRSLFGLNESLKAQKKFNYWVEREMREALRFASCPLELSDL